jgi:hypothetical protein
LAASLLNEMSARKLDSFDNICEYYRKWIIRIDSKEFERPVHLIWLSDSLDEFKDKMLVLPNGNLIGSFTTKGLINYVSKTKNEIFDKRKTKAWTIRIKGFRTKASTVNNFDLLTPSGKYIDKMEIEGIAHFINLFTDLVDTTKDAKLERLREKKEIKEIWEHFYNNIFWPRFNNPKKHKTFKVKRFKNDPKLQRTLKRMIKEFLKRIEIV